ncbi:hypothetical protein [Streptomyces kanasensis]|uniref:hypothetical protein n=1 Tax=Streptomyces kanasensis TaxID=936756 RepID=UPI0038034157
MPDEEHTSQFEDDLAVVLRRTGDGFAPGGGDDLVAGGVRRGRRRVARRRAAAVAGSVLTLALVGAGGAYATGALDGYRGGTDATVAAPPTAPRPSVVPKPSAATGAVPAADVLATFRRVLPPGGELRDAESRGTADERGPMAAGVYDDGRGAAAVGIGFFRVDPDDKGFSECPDKAFVDYDACTAEELPGGARLVVFQGYEYPDRREETKHWRATVLHPDGLVTDLGTWNAPAQKGAAVTRVDPPFTPAQLKRIVTHPAWAPVLRAVPKPVEAEPSTDPSDPGADAGGSFDGTAVRPTLLSLLPEGLTVTADGGDDGFAHAVVDDGAGRSLVQVNAQPDMGDVAGELFPAGSYETLPDGTKVAVQKRPGEKGGEGVVMWTVDTLRPDGYRVVVSAFNAGAQHEAATRAEPALSTAQLKALATSPKWLELQK